MGPSQAIVLRELVRCPGFVTVEQLADALGYEEAALQPVRSRTSRCTIAHHRIYTIVKRLRVDWGRDIIEASGRTGPGKPSLGYKLTEQGRKALGKIGEV